jgi:hypothetical protein
MASEEKRELLKAIAPVLKDAGFKKKDATWRRTKDSFIQIFNVQGSQWSKSFYFNLGVYITALGEDKAPLEHDSHIRNRADSLATDRERSGQLLDLENDIPADERYQELAELIDSRVIPWLEKTEKTSERRKRRQERRKRRQVLTLDYIEVEEVI